MPVAPERAEAQHSPPLTRSAVPTPRYPSLAPRSRAPPPPTQASYMEVPSSRRLGGPRRAAVPGGADGAAARQAAPAGQPASGSGTSGSPGGRLGSRCLPRHPPPPPPCQLAPGVGSAAPHAQPTAHEVGGLLPPCASSVSARDFSHPQRREQHAPRTPRYARPLMGASCSSASSWSMVSWRAGICGRGA
jgi:hypothetical protein